jgi:hypothetical protein
MPNQDDSASSDFLGGVRKGIGDTAVSLAKGTALVGSGAAKQAASIAKGASTAFGLATGPGGDNSNFPDDGSSR